MNLLIDTTNNQKVKIELGKKTFFQTSLTPGATDLLALLDKSLKELKVTPKEIEEIKINPGPGSFTGLRIGFSVANALGWALKIMVNNKNVSKGELTEIIYE